MKKKLFVLGLVAVLVVSLAGCASSAPSAGDDGSVPQSSSEAPPQESVPEEPESEPSSPEPEAEEPREKAVSIYLHQDAPQWDGFTPMWELTIEDEEELAMVEGLLSMENLVRNDEATWPDGGTSISFQIDYETHTVHGACNPQYVYRGTDYSNLWSGEDQVFYRYPQETGDALMAFLETKGITVSG